MKDDKNRDLKKHVEGMPKYCKMQFNRVNFRHVLQRVVSALIFEAAFGKVAHYYLAFYLCENIVQIMFSSRR